MHGKSLATPEGRLITNFSVPLQGEDSGFPSALRLKSFLFHSEIHFENYFFLYFQDKDRNK